ncbi:hypothetical protein RHMOL_Rhmol03G0014800 [Rhododendron molle]|uniref:Uncharacterized protein n=1 Tax=Rhododendron molle TaxID=49168 RepID=A0ACC0P9J0_RHOML|nr:hypothetical protein RHMOL_Rhmol03G0014800 [Rhododendron molle]
MVVANLKEEKEAINDDIIVFPRLKEVTLWILPKLKSFYTETQGFLFSHKAVFPVLKRMKFWNLAKITRIWDDQPLSEPEKEAKSFSELEHIFVDFCDQLEYVLPSYMLPQLKNLQELHIQMCTKVEVIISNNPKEKEATNNNDTIRFPQLKTLELWSLPNLKSFICSDETQSIFSNKVIFPVLKRVFISDLDKITRIWDDQPLSEPEKEAKSFSELEDICVHDCDQLEYVLPSYILPQLKNLQELHIESCRKMEVIISNNPKEKEATNNNDTIRFPQLKTLELWSLPNLKSFICSETQLFFSNKVVFPVLESLDFRDLDKITRIWDNQPLSEPEKEANFLQKTQVIGCNQLEYVLPFYMLPQLKNLQELFIWICTKVEDAFPVLKNIILDEDFEFLRNETSAKEVSIEEYCGTSGEESDYNGEEFDGDLETLTKEECSTSGKEKDHNGEELDEDLETPMKKVSMEECGTSGKENDHNGEQG